jgi:hypothetical protein
MATSWGSGCDLAVDNIVNLGSHGETAQPRKPARDSANKAVETVVEKARAEGLIPLAGRKTPTGTRRDETRDADRCLLGDDLDRNRELDVVM